jgi:hypothetical protein
MHGRDGCTLYFVHYEKSWEKGERYPKGKIDYERKVSDRGFSHHLRRLMLNFNSTGSFKEHEKV